MHDRRIHSRTKFHVKKSAFAKHDNIYQSLVIIFGNWLKRYFEKTVQDSKIIKPWLFKGGVLKSVGVKAEVRINDYDQQTKTAKVWLLRLEHKDSDFQHRLWRTDVSLNFINNDEAEVSVVVSWSIRTDYLGDEPEIPRASSPKVVTWINDNDEFICSSSGKRLSINATHLRVGDGRLLCEFIKSPTRSLPVVLINLRDQKQLINPDGLQKLLLGSAVVFTYDDYGVHEELQSEWGPNMVDNYQCAPDSVRVYQANLKQGDWRRHRFFLLREYGNRVNDLLRILTQSILRLNTIRQNEDHIYDFESLQANIQSKKLKSLRDASFNVETNKADKEYIDALEEENLRLEREREEIIRIREIQDDQILAQEIQIEEQSSRLIELEKQFAEMASSQKHLFEITRDVDELRQVWMELPTNLSSVLKMMEKINPDRLIVLKEAFSSADECKFDYIHDAWNLLMHMASTLHNFYFLNPVGNIEDAFQQTTGYQLTLKEGSQTKSDQKLMALRQRIYNGDEIDISPHTKIDKGSRHLRVHYYADHKKKLLVIGHFGNHLQTAGSARRGEK